MKTQKHICTLFLLLVIFLFTTIGITPAHAASDGTPPPIPTTGDVWDGSIEQPETLVQRDGIYYYEITKCSQLAYVAQTGGDWLTYNYILGNNLILNDVVLTWDEEGNCTNTEELLEWTPIDNFSGTFLGNGYVISGLYIFSDEYYYIGFFSELAGDVDGITIVNSCVSGSSAAGGIAGYAHKVGAKITNCIFSGAVKGESWVGGLIGFANCQYIDNLKNYGAVFGKGSVAGIVGRFSAYSVTNCTNYGNIYSSGTYAGGIVGVGNGIYSISYCQNLGTVMGTKYVGGITGQSAVYASYNSGIVNGQNYVGGIAGQAYKLGSCYNFGAIQGTDCIGGIAGIAQTDNTSISGCYNVGIVSFSSNGGTIAGKSDHIWGKNTVSNCYYLRDVTTTPNPFGNVAGDTAGVAEGLTDTQMKQQSSFANWDFDQTWSIDPTKNGGYPYLSWQTPGAVPVSGVSLNKETLSLAVGDQEYLTATVSPVTADNSSCTWASSNDQVASVSQSGKVTAIAPGSAEISVTTQDGGYTAVCAVTVLGRTLNEYRINNITLRDSNGERLRQIPTGSFWASVSITNQTSSGDTLVLLVSYDTNGKFLDMMSAQAKDLPVGATIELSFLMKNSTAQTASIKAFLISSLTDLTPISEAVSWQL